MLQRLREILSTPIALSSLVALIIVATGVAMLPSKSTPTTATVADVDPGVTVLPGSQQEMFASATRAILSLGNASSTDISEEKKKFYKEYLARELEKSNQDTVNALVQTVDPSLLQPRHAIADLNISADNSPEALRAYANDFGNIIKVYSNKDIEDEGVILGKALSTKKQSDLEHIEIPAVAYRNFSEELRKLKTPSLFATYHLDIVNGYDVMSRSLFLTEKVLTDPLTGNAGWQTYIAQMPKVAHGYAGDINVLHDKDITFAADEPGYYFRWNRTPATKKSL